MRGSPLAGEPKRMETIYKDKRAYDQSLSPLAGEPKRMETSPNKSSWERVPCLH